MAEGATWASGSDCSAGKQGSRAAGSLRRLTMATETQEAAKLAQLSHESPDEIEVAAGREREQLEGWVPELATDAEVREALEKAFDYRGDITLTRKDGTKVEGYLYDRRTGTTLSDSIVRVMPSDRGSRVNIAYSDIAAIAFSG